MQGLAFLICGAGTLDAARHGLANRWGYRRGMAGKPVAPDQGHGDLVLAEIAVLGVRAVATARDGIVLDPDFRAVGIRSSDLGVQGRFGHRVLIQHLHSARHGVGLSTLENGRAAGLPE
jgi:hypothetical protein